MKLVSNIGLKIAAEVNSKSQNFLPHPNMVGERFSLTQVVDFVLYRKGSDRSLGFYPSPEHLLNFLSSLIFLHGWGKLTNLRCSDY